MIDRKDVVTLKTPFPNISSELAIRSHMYICHRVKDKTKYFVKCQSIKPYMLIKNTMNHFLDEQPDIQRNPFKNSTRIDCDKDFYTLNLCYPKRLCTTIRPDVCEDVIQKVDVALTSDGYDSHSLNEQEMLQLNIGIYRT